MAFIRPQMANANVSILDFISMIDLDYNTITLAFCKNNCAETGSSGCIRCRTGFAAVPECCRCGDGLEEINGECSKLAEPSSII